MLSKRTGRVRLRSMETGTHSNPHTRILRARSRHAFSAAARRGVAANFGTVGSARIRKPDPRAGIAHESVGIRRRWGSPPRRIVPSSLQGFVGSMARTMADALAVSK